MPFNLWLVNGKGFINSTSSSETRLLRRWIQDPLHLTSSSLDGRTHSTGQEVLNRFPEPPAAMILTSFTSRFTPNFDPPPEELLDLLRHDVPEDDPYVRYPSVPEVLNAVLYVRLVRDRYQLLRTIGR